MTPQVRDAAASKERILQAAFCEFTRRGFAGARVDEIAGGAQCNKALVYHYFEDKEALFRSVLECKLSQLTDLARFRENPERFAELVGEFFDFHAANPEMTRLAMWEALDFGGREELVNEEQRRARFAEHVDAIRDAQRAGTVDPDLDARDTLITMMGLVTTWFAFPQNARLVFGEDPYTPEALQRRRAHVVEIARRILERK